MKLSGNRCRCTACGKYFYSTYAFDKHRAGKGMDRYCLDDGRMRLKGMNVNKHGVWVGQENKRFK